MAHGNKKRKNKARKHPNWRDLSYILMIIVGLVIIYFGMYRTEIEGKGFEGILGILIEIFIALIIASLEKKKGTETYVDVPNDVLSLGRMIILAIKHNLLARVGAFVFVCYLIGNILGWIGCIDIYQDVMYAISHHKEFEPPTEISSEKESDNEYVAKPELDEADKEWFEHQDPVVVSRVEELKISVFELEAVRTLSDDDAELIFFLDGEYKINNWENDEEVQEQVRDFVKDYYKKDRENLFDNYADQDIHNEVSYYSDTESKIILFSIRKENMERRQDIYSIYPKAKLALLISNDEHILALTLFRNGGNESSMLYYYAKAIEYRIERVTFKEVSEDSLKSNIEWIGARYADITYTCPNSEYKMYAEKLSNAFNEIAKEY